MAQIICQVLHRPDRVTLIWSEGKASFEPYDVTGAALEDLRTLGVDIRTALRTGNTKQLADAGEQLRELLFPEAGQTAATWLAGLKDVETLEIVSDEPGAVPWNVVAADSQSAWGLHYPITTARRVDPLREYPFVEQPEIVVAVDPMFRQSLSERSRTLLSEFAREKSLLVVESREQLATAFKSEPPDLIVFFCQADVQHLYLGEDRIGATDLQTMIGEGGGNPAPLVCLNLSAAGDGSTVPTRAFLSAGLHGLIGCEVPLAPDDAVALGIRLFESFVYGGLPIARALQKVRTDLGPAGLAYSAFCPADLKVAWEEGAGEMYGIEPRPLPDSPYRPLMPYDREERALFVGRDHDLTAFATQLDPAQTRLMVLHGTSGVGKSSFLRAAVIPFLEEVSVGFRALRDRRPDEGEAPVAEDDHVVLSIRASQDLLGQLSEALHAFCSQPFTYTTPAGQTVSVDLPEILRGEVHRQAASTAIQGGVSGIQTAPAATPSAFPESIKPPEVTAVAVWDKMHADRDFLKRLMQRISERLPFELVILVEQGEEFFIQARSASQQRRRREDLAILGAAVAAGTAKWILSIRTDYFGRLAHFLPPGQGFADYLLPPLPEAELVEAMLLPTVSEPIPYSTEVPFAKYGFAYEEGLAVTLAGEVARAARAQQISPLPLLQALCASLAELAAGRPDKVIRKADLTRVGGSDGALAKFVDTRIKALPVPSTEQRALRELFDELYLREPDGTVVRQVLPAGDVAGRWKGVTVGETIERAAADDVRLLEVNHLLVGGKETDYVSLSQDALAQLGAHWAEEKKRLQYGRTKIVDMLWIFLPLMVLVAAVTIWVMRRGGSPDSAALAKAEEKLGEFERLFQTDNAKALQRAFSTEISRLDYSLKMQGAELALLLQNGARARALLREARASFAAIGKEPPRFEWNYLWRLTESKGMPFTVPEVNALALTPDGKTLVLAGRDGQIQLLNVEGEEPTDQGILKGHAGGTLSLAISSDGKLLASGGADSTVRIWSLEKIRDTKELHAVKDIAKSPVRAVAISKDGATLAFAGEDKKIFLWSLEKQKALPELEGHKDAVHALVFSEKDLISAGADGTLKIWDPLAAKTKKDLAGHNGPVHCLALAPDGKTLASGGVDPSSGSSVGVAYQWDLATGQKKPERLVHSTSIQALAYVKGGEFLITGSQDNALRVWDAKTGNEIGARLGHGAGIRAIAVSSDGKTLVSASSDSLDRKTRKVRSSILSWTTTSLVQRNELPHADATAVTFARNDKILVSAGRDGSVKFWDVATGAIVGTLPQSIPDLTCLALHSDDKSWQLAVGVGDKGRGAVHLWEIEPAKPASAKDPIKLEGHSAGVNAIGFSQDGKWLASASRDGTALLWEVATKKKQHTLADHKGPVTCLAWGPKGTRLATGGEDRTVRVWTIGKEEKPQVLHGPEGQRGVVTAITFAQNFQSNTDTYIPCIVSVGHDSRLIYWNSSSSGAFKPEPEPYFTEHGGAPLAIAWNPKKKLLVTGSEDKTLKLWTPRLAAERFTFFGHTAPVRAVAFSFDGDTIASAGADGLIRLWRGAPLPSAARTREAQEDD